MIKTPPLPSHLVTSFDPQVWRKDPCLMFVVGIRPGGLFVVFLVQSTVLTLFIFCDVHEHGLSYGM